MGAARGFGRHQVKYDGLAGLVPIGQAATPRARNPGFRAVLGLLTTVNQHRAARLFDIAKALFDRTVQGLEHGVSPSLEALDSLAARFVSI